VLLICETAIKGQTSASSYRQPLPKLLQTINNQLRFLSF